MEKTSYEFKLIHRAARALSDLSDSDFVEAYNVYAYEACDCLIYSFEEFEQIARDADPLDLIRWGAVCPDLLTLDYFTFDGYGYPVAPDWDGLAYVLADSILSGGSTTDAAREALEGVGLNV